MKGDDGRYRFNTRIGDFNLKVNVVFEFEPGEQGDDECGPIDDEIIIYRVFEQDPVRCIQSILSTEVLSQLESEALRYARDQE